MLTVDQTMRRVRDIVHSSEMREERKEPFIQMVERELRAARSRRNMERVGIAVFAVAMTALLGVSAYLYWTLLF